MKNYIITILILLASVNALAVKHNLKDNGLAVGLNRVVANATNRNALAPIIQKYHARVQQGQYDIPIEDLQELYEELCKLNCDGKHQI